MDLVMLKADHTQKAVTFLCIINDESKNEINYI